jgi:ML domain
VKAVVHGIIMGMDVPFQLPQPDACVDSGVACPVAPGKSYRYTATLPVLKVYPKVKGHNAFLLSNQFQLSSLISFSSTDQGPSEVATEESRRRHRVRAYSR